ncbi:ral-GDS-related protein-like [Manis javanica]|uniref:ral-GDS-related protein-like n=1 Tax=Manis javanica TaxID=9974 RepID=UPI003C6D8E57
MWRGTVWGPHCPLRGGPRSPECLLPHYQARALQSSTLGSEEELVDGLTYSIFLDLGQREPEPSVHGTEVPKHRTPWTRVRRKWRKRTARVEPAPNTSQSAPELTLLPEDADQLTTGQRLPRPSPSPRMGRARRLAWEPEHAPRVHHDSQPSSTLEDQVHHHLVQEMYLGPTVAELQALRRRRPRWHAWYLLCHHYLQPVQELPETPVLELQPASRASVCAEPGDVPAVASVPVLAASTWDIPGVVSGPELQPHDPLSPGPRAPAGTALGQGEPDVGLEPTRPCTASTQDMWRKEEPPILVFAPRLVAKQLTLMCAELFMKVRYSECQAYLWHQPQTGTIEHIAPTIHKVMKQIEATVRLVTTSCLGTPSMTAQDRARVVEFWIRVAEECWYLRNHAALHAIVSALQCPAIRHLDSTWSHVSWESSWIYKKLKNTDKGVNRKQLLEEARAIVKQQLWAVRASQDVKKQGMVPFLGVFLDDLLADQLPEHDEEVTNILYQIMMHKRVARLYDLEPDERFQSFFQTVELLDEEQSYRLSCQVEPPGQGPGRKGALQLFRSHV